MTWTRTRAVSALALGTASAILLSACGSSPEASVGPSHAPVTVSVGFYGDFGLTKLEAKYEKSHPWVDLQLNSGDYAPQHDLLQQALETGSGAYTVMAIDEGYLSRFVPQADSFVNLLDLGAADSKTKFPEWAWAEAANTDGTKLIALPNSLYGLAVCYRSDLFAAAGLESDRAAVSSTISGSWDNFISEGQKYVAATGKPFIDDAKTVLDPAVKQLGTGHSYYDANLKLDMENIKPAFDIATGVIGANLSANVARYSPEWYTGLSDGKFAAVICPQWMLGMIQKNVPTDFTGKWDIATLPGTGGNQGGSFWAIPKQGTADQQAAGYEFVQWLLEPEQQIEMMTATGTLSAQTALLTSDTVTAFTSAFFNDAPYGEIFARSILGVPAPVSFAPKNLTMQAGMESVLDQVEAGDISIADAWDLALATADAGDAAP
jgi:cellobiose transport system substrate-binding protein